MKVVVIHESRTGNTRQAAEWIGGAAEAEGAEVHVFASDQVGPGQLADADLVFVGTWTDGLFLLGHRPGGSRNLKAMPDLWHKRVVPFVTYAVNPGRVVDKLGGLLSRKGADVLPGRAFHRGRLPDGVVEFVRQSMATVSVR